MPETSHGIQEHSLSVDCVLMDSSNFDDTDVRLLNVEHVQCQVSREIDECTFFPYVSLDLQIFTHPNLSE